MTRTLTSKRPGPCAQGCSVPIRIGEPIRWSPGRGAWHLDCDKAKRQHDAAEARARYLDALGTLRAMFADAPEWSGTLPDERVCIAAGFPSWSQIVYFSDTHALLWTVGSEHPRRASTIHALPLTEELRALVRAAEYFGGNDA